MAKRAAQSDPKRFADRLIEAMEEIFADARGEPNGVIRFSLPPNPKPGDAWAAVEAAAAEAEERQRAHQAKLVAEKIRAVRQTVGVEDRTLSRYFGVSVATVKAWEAGTKTPTGANLHLLTDMVARPRYWKKQLRAALAREGVS